MENNTNKNKGEDKKITHSIDRARANHAWADLSCELKNLVGLRRSQIKLARNGKRVRIIGNMELVEDINEGGRFLVTPPLVARDASIIENQLSLSKIHSVVLCREPTTSLGLCPVVSLGRGVTVRVHVEEPNSQTKPSCEWFDYAVSELGEYVVSKIDQSSSKQRQLDYLLAHLSAVPVSIKAHLSAINLCKALESERV
ncbi:MAG: hypothetical protein QF718_07910 [Phycisphaerales bacterium]|jgi:hypothetical protein|nr:hypothetical protein [Phycisphaerales bacterium]